MNCQVFRNKQTNEIEEVLAPNGQESILFRDLLNEYKDKEVALEKWATTYTPSFKADYKGNYDINGEVFMQVQNTSKPGVDFVFESNPELSNIGSKEQYSQYLDSIFPESKIQDIVYHGTKSKFESFQQMKSNRLTGKGYYFSELKNYSERYAKNISEDGKGVILPALVNLTNPTFDYTSIQTVEPKDYVGYDGLYEEDFQFIEGVQKYVKKEIVVFEPSQIHILGSKEDLKGFKEFVSTKDFSPRTMSEVETKDLATKIRELDTSFEGLSHLQVGQAISMLVNEVSTRALEGKVNLEETFNKLAGELTVALTKFKSIDLKLVPNKAKGIQTLIDNYEATLENFEELKEFATKILEEDDKFKLDIEEVTDDKGEVYDIAVYEIDPKSGITPTMKRVLGGFTKNKTNYLGKPEYVSFEEAFNTIAAIVADKPHNMEEVLKALEQHKEARPWLNQAIDRLKKLDKQLQNQFLSRMVMSKLDMKYVNLVQDGDSFKLQVINTNRNDIGTTIHGDWMQNIKTTSIMRPYQGSYKVDKGVYQELKDIYDKEEHTIDDFNTIMITLGVNLSPLTLEKIAQFGLDNKPLEKLFTEKEGLVNILMTELDGMIKADKTLSDVNPLSQGVMSKLAYFEARFNTASYLTPNTFRSEEKQLYGYTMHCMLTDRVKNLLNGKMVSDLQDASFTKHSYYLTLLDPNNKTQTAINFRNRFNVFDSDLKAFEVNMPGNKQKAEGFTSLAEAEHELTKIAYFMDNNSKVKDGMRTAKYILPTMSDKTRVMGMEGLAIDLTGKNLPELVYDRVVYPEIDRILTHSNKDIKSYNDGARLIMFLPELNSVEINDDGVTVFEFLNEMKNLAQTDAGKELIKEKLLPKIQEYIDALIAEKKATFERLEITDKIPRQKRFVEEYVINNLINITEAYQLFVGDPAMFYKTTVLKDIMKYDTLSKEDKVKISEETFINVGKRLAMQIAPGTKLADSEKNHYYQIMLKDRKSKSLVHDYLVAIMGEENARAYGGEEIEGTDAQEFVTWQEHLYVLEKLGEIEPFTNLEGEEVTPEDIAEARKICESTLTYEQLNDSQKKLLTKLVQVMKPVYTGQVLKDGVMQVVYIKSSAIALIPQLTQGLEIDKLRLSMENFQEKYMTTQNGLQGTVRATFGSAAKVGNVLNPVSLWNKDGSIKEMSMEEMEKAYIQLPRENFRIQQANPFKSGKKKKQDTVTIGSQERKLLFTNLLKLSNFEFQGKKYKGAELAAKYNQLYDDLFKLNLSSLHEELGIDPTSNVPISKQVSVETLAELLQKEATERNYPIGDIRGLQLKDGKFVIPLWLHSSSDKYESLLNSIVSNRVIGLKFPGYTYVMTSEEGFKDKKIIEFDKVDETLKSKIVFTDKWEGELKAARFVLKSTGETITKSINSYPASEIEFRPAQVIVPMKFRDAKGNLLNLLEKDSSGNYLYIKDTARGFRLDMTKFDKQTLELFGFRIPSSGLMSMTSLEIVGFTPLESGDSMISPRDFTKQMGADFDVDKLVTYMYNTKLINGKITKDDSSEEKKLQNDIIELHQAVLSHKSDYVQAQILRPLSFEFAGKMASDIESKRRGESKGMFTPLSTEYQKMKMMSGSSGKTGVGVYSLDVVFHANTQALNALGTPISLYSKEASSAYRLKVAGVEGHENFGEEMTVTPNEVDIAIDYLKTIEQPTETDKKFMELMVVSTDKSSIMAFKEQYPGVIEKELEEYRFISDVLAEAQNYATDNEKEQIMGRINDNSITFNARKPLNMMGIDKSFTKVNTGKEFKRMSVVNLFMTQTVLMDRVTPMMNSKNSTLAKYDATPLANVVIDINIELNKYLGKNQDSGLDIEETVANMSAQEMYDMIGLEFDKMTPRQLTLQKAILYKFATLDAIGTQINSIQTSINTDSKKLGKSLFENIATLEKVLKLPGKTVVIEGGKYTFTNAEKLIGEFRITPFEGATQVIKGVYIKPTTVNGFATIYGLVTAVQMYQEIFPYTSSQFNEVANTLGQVLGKEETTTKLRQSLLKTLKSYAYANANTQNLEKSVDETRAELFIDTDSNTSLAKFIKEAKQIYPKLDRYAVINSLKLEVESNGLPSILKWNNSVKVEFEDQFYLSFLAMLEDTTPIGTYNGKEMTIQSLAQNMITYSYLEGGIQLATQFIRHIPVEYLETFGIASKLNQFNVSSPEAYGIDTTQMKDDTYIPDIIKQHVQHNPRQLPQLPEEFNDSEFIETKEVKDKLKFTPPFAITFNPKLAVKGIRNSGITIFELTDSGYIAIPTLGVSNFNEFNMDKKGETQKSLVHVTPVKVEAKPKVESKPDKKGIKYTYNLDQGSSREVLKVINNSLSSLFLESDVDFKLEIAKGYEFEAVYSNGVITLSEGFLKDVESGVKSYSYFERIMLEEYSHGLIRKAIENPTERGKELLNQISRYYNRARTKIIEKFGQERLDAVEARFRTEGITEEERKYIYGGVNMIEFTGHLLTNSDFQEMLNEVVFEVDSKPNTFWSKIKELLSNLLLDFINVPNLKENSLTTMAVADILELIGENRSKEVKRSRPLGNEVEEGVFINNEGLNKEEQLELFNYLKPYLEEQASKTNKGLQAPKMIGLNLRWDYVSNNPTNKQIVIKDPLVEQQHKYGYYDVSIDGKPLGRITSRFRQLIEKATGINIDNYDGAIINLYDDMGFISSHNDVEESKSAEKYPVVAVNIGGSGNFHINNKSVQLKAGAGYTFGVNGKNRMAYHRTFQSKQDGFLPEITTKQDGKTYEKGSYRITITMRRVMPLDKNMPNNPLNESKESNPLIQAEVKPKVEIENTPVKESKVETPATNTNLKSREYKLPNGKTIVFNDQQWEGLQKMEKFLGDKSKQTFTLSGYAGTGKSTLVKKILDNYKNRVVVSAPTHKAVGVISLTTEKAGVTLQSLLGLKPGYELDNYSAANPQFARAGVGTLRNYNLVIIDESSMINSALFELIMSDAEKAGTKIIFMGDEAQIPPVGEDVSKVFSESDEIHQLTQVERTKGSNPLMLIFDAIRSNIKSKFDNFKHETVINQDGEGVEFTDRSTTFQERVLSWFRSPEFAKDSNYAKVITWTNPEAETWNNIIRGELIDSEEVIAVGDLLMGYRSILMGKELLVTNSMDYKVTKVVPKTKTYTHQEEVVQLKGFDTTFKSGETVFIVDHQDKDTEAIYKKIMYDNTTYSKRFKNWNTYYAFADNFMSLQKYSIKGEVIPRTFDYGYVVTAHKAQGSTYNKVGMIEDNMDGNKKTKEKNQIKYVAFSRAKENVISLSSKTGSKIQRETFKDDIIEGEDEVIDMSQYDDSQNRPISDLFADNSPKDFKVDEFKSSLSDDDRKLFNRLKREGVIKTKCK